MKNGALTMWLNAKGYTSDDWPYNVPDQVLDEVDHMFGGKVDEEGQVIQPLGRAANEPDNIRPVEPAPGVKAMLDDNSAEGIYAAVMAAAQPAEDLGGPEGAE